MTLSSGQRSPDDVRQRQTGLNDSGVDSVVPCSCYAKRAWTGISTRCRRRKVETGGEDKIRKNEDTSAMVVASSFNVCVCEQKDGEDDGYDIPSREYKARRRSVSVKKMATLGHT